MSIKNFILKSINQKSIFDNASALASTNSWNQGDLMVYFSGAIRAIASGDTGTNFLGIATQTVSSGTIASAYSTDNTTKDNAIQGPVYGVTASLVCKTSDAFIAGQLVYPYPASGTRYVTSVSGSLLPIGIYQGPAIASAAAAQEIEVLVGSNYGSGYLNF
jgi:hypothetical protein